MFPAARATKTPKLSVSFCISHPDGVVAQFIGSVECPRRVSPALKGRSMGEAPTALRAEMPLFRMLCSLSCSASSTHRVVGASPIDLPFRAGLSVYATTNAHPDFQSRELRRSCPAFYYGRRSICFISVTLPAFARASSSEIRPARTYLIKHWFMVCMPQKFPSAIAP